MLGLVPESAFTYVETPEGGSSSDDVVALTWTSPQGVTHFGAAPTARADGN